MRNEDWKHVRFQTVRALHFSLTWSTDYNSWARYIHFKRFDLLSWARYIHFKRFDLLSWARYIHFKRFDPRLLWELMHQFLTLKLLIKKLIFKILIDFCVRGTVGLIFPLDQIKIGIRWIFLMIENTNSKNLYMEKFILISTQKYFKD